MRIPPSVLVMSVVTAVPFGLGIRDTLRHDDASAELGDALDFGGAKRSAREREELARWEVEQQREAAEREARNLHRVAILDQLYGTKPASMGSLLDGIVLGASAGSFQPENARVRIERASGDGLVRVSFDADAKSLNAVELAIRSDYETGDMCEQLDDKLVAAWGPSTNGVWIEAMTHQRALLDHDDCQLRFDRYIDPAGWVAQLPLAAVGASPEKLVESLAGSVDVEHVGDRVRWNAPGLGYGRSETHVDAYVVNGKIVGFKASVDGDFDSILAVRDGLSATFEAQPKKTVGVVDPPNPYEIGDTWEWKRRVPVTLSRASGNVHTLILSVGTTPWD